MSAASERSKRSWRLKKFREKYSISNPDEEVMNLYYDQFRKFYQAVLGFIFLIRKYGSWQTVLDMLNFAEEVKQYGTYQQAIEYMKNHKAAEDKEELDKLINGKWGSE